MDQYLTATTPPNFDFTVHLGIAVLVGGTVLFGLTLLLSRWLAKRR